MGMSLVLFDGVCNLCAKSVRFVLRHEMSSTLRFTPVQSSTGNRLMRELGLNPKDAESFVLITGGSAFVRSDAAIHLSAFLRGGWRLIGWIRIIPRPIRDWLYGVIARNRYKWFGQSDVCLVPTPELSARFIND